MRRPRRPARTRTRTRTRTRSEYVYEYEYVYGVVYGVGIWVRRQPASDAQTELSARSALATVRRVRYAINEKEVTFRVLDDGAVIVHCETGYYYTLNATGTFLWELLSEGDRTREELVAELASAFEQDEAAVAVDVQQHLDDLQRENLVIVR